MMYWNDGGSWGWAGWIGMGVMMVVFWGLLAWVAVSLVRSSGRREPERSPSTPEDVLAERFARGEIDEVDYQQRAAALRKERVHTS